MTGKTSASSGLDPRRLGLETSGIKSRILQGKAAAKPAKGPPRERRKTPKRAKAPRSAQERATGGLVTGKRIAAGAAIASACVLTLAFAVSEPAEQYADGVKAVSLDQGIGIDAALPNADRDDPLGNLRGRLEETLAENRRLTDALARSEAQLQALAEKRIAESAKAAALEASLQNLRREHGELLAERARATALAAELAVARRALAQLRDREEDLLDARRRLFSTAETTVPVLKSSTSAAARTKPTAKPEASTAAPGNGFDGDATGKTDAGSIMPLAAAARKIQPSAEQRTALREGVEAYKGGRYAAAQAEWLPLAQQGYAWAQFLLGSLLAEGRTAAATPEAAFAWLSLARDNGVSEAAAVLKKLEPPRSAETTGPDEADANAPAAG